MRKIREVLRLSHGSLLSRRAVAASLGISRDAVADSPQIGGLDGFKMPDVMTIDTIKRMLTNYQSLRSRELRKFKDSLDQVCSLSDEDLQALGMTNDLLAEARAAQNQLEQVSGKRSKSKAKSPPSDPEAS